MIAPPYQQRSNAMFDQYSAAPNNSWSTSYAPQAYAPPPPPPMPNQSAYAPQAYSQPAPSYQQGAAGTAPYQGYQDTAPPIVQGMDGNLYTVTYTDKNGVPCGIAPYVPPIDDFTCHDFYNYVGSLLPFSTSMGGFVHDAVWPAWAQQRGYPVGQNSSQAYPQAGQAYAQPAQPYAQPAQPYAQPAQPYAQPASYPQAGQAYPQLVPGYSQPAQSYPQSGYLGSVCSTC